MTEYKKNIEIWRAEKDRSIRAENSWIALCGLFWLTQGTNAIGSSPDAAIRLPDRFPPNLGHIDFDGKAATLNLPTESHARVNGVEGTSGTLQPDMSESPDFVTMEDVRFVLIQRGERFGVRMWDNQREERRSTPPRTWYEVDERVRVPAVFSPYEQPIKTVFPDVSGEGTEYSVDGALTFELLGNTHKLDVNHDEEGTFFIRFADLTSKDETYPTGRYLLTELDPSGNIIIDFNKAFNPPCAFTGFATCIFAPKQNHLNLRLEAGEKYTRH